MTGAQFLVLAGAQPEETGEPSGIRSSHPAHHPEQLPEWGDNPTNLDIPEFYVGKFGLQEEFRG